MNEQNASDILINPFYAINISPILSDEHEPMTTKGMWVKANLKLIDEIGKEEWLNRLLHVLETGELQTIEE